MSVNTNEPVADDLKPIVEYYRKRASDLEFEFLQFQVAASKTIEQLRNDLASAEAQHKEKAAAKPSGKAQS